MARVIGRNTAIGLGLESTRGTAVAPQFWIPVRTLDFDDKVSYLKNDSGYSRIEELNDAHIQNTWAAGGYGGKIHDRSVGAELAALFGQLPASVQRATSGVYDHTFSLLNSNQHKSATVAVKEDNFDGRYPSGMINTWSLEAVLDNYVSRSIDLLSKKGAVVSNTVSYTEENEFMPDHVSVKLATALAGLDAASALKVRSISLNVAKNVEALFILSSKEPDDIVNKQISISGSIEAYYDDVATFRNLVFQDGKRALRLDMVSGVDIGSGHNPALRFDLSKVSFGEFSRDHDNNNVTAQTINFDALLSLSEGSMVTARLTNTQANYS